MSESGQSPVQGAGPLLDELARSLPGGFALRTRTDADLEFLARLYASTRQDELRVVPWTDEQKAAFLLDQFNKQHFHYTTYHPDSLWLVLEQDGQPVGRLYVNLAAREVRVMDIALLPALRSRGLGTSMLQAVIKQADRLDLPVTLHVEPVNPARRLYQRLGFLDVETVGYYQLMQHPPQAARAGSH